MTELLARLNPELLRGLRAECTLLRLAVTLLLCAGVAWCAQLAFGWSAVERIGLIAAGVLSFVVTPVRIAGAISEEHDRHTWHRQRMSALSPAQLMLGKAFGSTALTDLAALCALACWGLGAHLPVAEVIAESQGIPLAEAAGKLERSRASFPLDAWLMVCANLLGRFLALALAIRNCDRSRNARGRSFAAAILLTGLLIGSLTVLKNSLALSPVAEASILPPSWFGLAPMDNDIFWAVSGLALAAFAAYWCWCAARETLSGGRFASEAVVASLGVGLLWAGAMHGAWEAAGPPLFAASYYDAGRMATLALLLALVATAYLWGVAERVDRRRTREFLAAPRPRSAPAWLVIALLAAAAAALHLISGLFAERGEHGFFQTNLWVISLLGFVARDMGILFLVLTGRIKRWPELAALASWLVLGLFLPAALSGAGASVAGFELYLLFAPVAPQETAAHTFIGLASAWLQAGLVIMWLVRRGRPEARRNNVVGNT